MAVTNERVLIEPNQYLTPCEYAGQNIAMGIQFGKLTNTAPSTAGAFTKLRQNKYFLGINTQYLLDVGLTVYSGKESIGKVREQVTNDCVAKFVN